MARVKRQPKTQAEELWDLYQAIQLTPAQKAEARERMQEKVDEARRNGVYEGLLSLAGKVHLDMDDLREARKSRKR
ncbi:MAG TPA: hypothetical protein VEK79_20040 [Thermoanaerobaculia bacterium]|nr:hypothetical protein [Thermoanaerobaculia bacterium]